MESDLIELHDVHPFLPTKPAGQVWSREQQKYVASRTDPPQGYAVHVLEPNNSRQLDPNRLSRNEMALTCRVVRAPDENGLKLPPEVDHEYTFPLTLNGYAGEALLDFTPNEQIPEVRDELGFKFGAVWRFYD